MSDRLRLGPILETGQLSRVRELIGSVDRSGSLLELATPKAAALLREISETNAVWEVLVSDQQQGREGDSDGSTCDK